MRQVKKKLGRGLALLLAVLQVMLVFAVVPVSAADDTVANGTCGNEPNGGNLTWTLDSEGTLTISPGDGTTYGMKNYSSDPENIAPWRDIAVKNVVIAEGVTSIGQYAFYGCKDLESVELPTSMRYFESFAFENCSSLTSVTIPEGVTTIEEGAFYGCEALTSVTIPSSVTTIGSDAFYNCSSSMGVNYTGTKEQWKGISISTSNVSLANAIINCKDGTMEFHTLTGMISDSENGYFYKPTAPEEKPKTYKQSAREGSTVQYCVYADEDKDYVLAALTVDGERIPEAENQQKYAGTYTMEDHDATIEASFKPRPDEGKCGEDLAWKLDNGILTISGSGAMWNYTEPEPAPWNKKTDRIKKVVMEAGITSIGQYAFANCENLTDVTIPETVTYIGYYAFAYCKSLTGVALPESITTIGGYAFDYCSSLKTVNIPASVTTIEQAAFRGCTSLTSIAIPASVTYIGIAPFAGASCNFTVAEDNPYYCADGGALFNNDKTTLYGYYGKQTEYEIPTTVKVIELDAFSDCSNLTSVIIPDGVTTIQYGTFYECTKLTSVTIPASVETIGNTAFLTCNSLKTVNYNGTKAQWENISIGYSNDALIKATIKCNDGVINAPRYTLSGRIDDFGYFSGGSTEYEESAKEGDNVWYCVYADDGYVLQELQVGDEIHTIEKTSYADYYTMGAENATITATFRPESDDGFTIDCSSDSENGTISVANTRVKAGETVTVTVTPNKGYKLDYLTCNYEVKGVPQRNDIQKDDNGAYTFKMPARNVHLKASFKIAKEYDFSIREDDAEITSKVEDIPDTELKGAEVTGIGGAVDANKILEKNNLETPTEMILYATVTVTEADLTAASQTVSFEVKPFAIMTLPAGIPTVEISNEMLNGNPITVKLPIPTKIKDLKEIVHISDDGTKEYFTLDGAKQFTIEELPSGQRVAVLQVTHFSTFTMYDTAHEHDVELTGAKAATCTEGGYTGDQVCKICGVTIEKGQTIPKLGHKTEVKNAKNATCTEDGYTGDQVCKTCGKTVETGKAIPAKGHTWDNGKVTQKPTLTKEGVKTYTCTVCNETKTERIEKLTTCEAGEDCPTHNYKDVKSSQWYHLDVDYVVESGLMVGDGGGIFRPDNNLSRAEMVQVLYNWAGKPEVTGSSKFSDVENGAWYAKPVIWATENGIVYGVGDGKFAPNELVTREQLVAMLYRYAEKPEVSNKLTDFADASKVSDYAVDAVKWAVEQNILRGDGSPRKLRPTDHAKRCEVAAMLHRYIG